MNFHVAHIVESLESKTGGPAYSVPALVAALNRIGVRSEVLCRNVGDYKGEAPATKVAPGALAHVIGGLVQNSSARVIIHEHGVWTRFNHESALTANRLSIPRVLSPRGMLEPWSLRHKRLKKHIAWLLYQKRDFRSADMIHVTSSLELESIRRLSREVPILMAPNGVDIPEVMPFPIGSPRRLLFLSRIHPKKGIENLVEAWAVVWPQGWVLDIVGPGDKQYLDRIRNLILRRKVEATVNLKQQVSGIEKHRVYAESQALVLPSFSENFGMVIAEALASGRPVIATKATSWAELGQRGCGWSIDIGVKPLAHALSELVSLSPSELAVMGDVGRNWMIDSFSWSRIARDIAKGYERLMVN